MLSTRGELYNLADYKRLLQSVVTFSRRDNYIACLTGTVILAGRWGNFCVQQGVVCFLVG